MTKMTLLRKPVQASSTRSRVIQRKNKPAVPLHPVLRLQQTAGNQAVGRLIQAKLKVGQPGDRYEREADRVADQVMRMPELQVHRQPVEDEELRGQPIEAEEEETVQTKQVPGRTPEVSSNSEATIKALRGSGQPLPVSMRAFFESHFGYDFSHIRIHTDAQAAESAQMVNARAFTLGHNIVFGAGQYVPTTMRGRRLLAHELAHVVQQRAGNKVRHGNPSRKVESPASPHIQQDVIQRDGPAPPPAPAALPSLLGSREALHSFVREQMAREETPVRRWLDENTDRLRLLSLATLVSRVRRNVPEAATLPDIQIQNVIQEWANRHGITIPSISAIPEPGVSEIPPAEPGPSIADSGLVSALRHVLSVPTEINVERQHGRANISPSGATVELRRGVLRAGSTLGWDGTMGISTAYSGLRFSGSLSADQWRLGLSYSLGPSMPNLAELASIFQAGEAGLRGIVEATRSFENLDDVSAVSDAISPHLKAVKAAVKAARQIAAAERGRVSFGVSAGVSGPGPSPESSAQTGFQFAATLTIRF